MDSYMLSMADASISPSASDEQNPFQRQQGDFSDCHEGSWDSLPPIVVAFSWKLDEGGVFQEITVAGSTFRLPLR